MRRWNDEWLRAIAGSAGLAGELHREGRGERAPREVPDRQVRITSDESDPKATRSWDVAVWRITEALWSTGKLIRRCNVACIWTAKPLIGFGIKIVFHSLIRFECAECSTNVVGGWNEIDKLMHHVTLSANSKAHWSWHTINYEFLAFLFRVFRGKRANIFMLLLSLQNEAVDVDIDEILDMDTDDIRRSHLFVSRSLDWTLIRLRMLIWKIQ